MRLMSRDKAGVELDIFADQYRREKGLESFVGDYWVEYLVDSLYRFRHILSWLPREDTLSILDIGTTPFTWFLKMQCPRAAVATIDRTDHRFGADCDAKGVVFRTCDLERDPIPFADGVFDVVIFTAVLDHIVVPPSEILAEIRRVL